jgi:deoxycytidylate deaminase
VSQKTNAELIFGLVYPVGADTEPVLAVLTDYLAQLSYACETFRISDYLRSLSLDIEFDDADRLGLTNALMDAGNRARELTDADDILAVAAINDIFVKRRKDENGDTTPSLNVVHVVRSLKRPEEVKLLREMYRPGFFLLGLVADDDQQIEYLRSRKGLSEAQAKEVIARDQEESTPHGQRTRDTFYLADVFLQLSGEAYKDQLKRFLDLVFGAPFKTPTRDEHAMFLAYASSARSAQLGRQVGAAIATTDGEVLSVGFNEVPAAGGGPYWEGDDKDHRDHTKDKDPNVEHKTRIVDSIVNKLESKLLTEKAIRPLLNTALAAHVPESKLSEALDVAVEALKKEYASRPVAVRAVEQSDFREITEYGRAVHAEMDALLTCARLGISVKGRILYTTTFPCHNCTRHIVAAGISGLFYIEPYPKSKSKDLHDDAITFDLEDAEKSGKIPFLPFIGVGPRRYLDFFSLHLTTGRDIERKTKDGKPVKWSWREHTGPHVPMLPYSYLEREEKAIDERKNALKKLLEEKNGEH